MKQRIVTGVLAAVVFIGILLLGGISYACLIAILGLIGFYEFAKLNGLKAFSIASIIGYAVVLILIMEQDRLIANIDVPHDALLWFAMLLLFLITVFSKNRIHLQHIAVLFLGAFYIGFGFRFMVTTRLLPEDGFFWTLFIFACIWVTDSGAYFAGRAFGKHPLAPAISPKKTIEGSIGGVICAVVCAVGFALYNPEIMSWSEALMIGLIIGIVGQLGDLIQSAYKRFKGVKDSGNLLPGHGGVLDRVDSWLIVFPAICMSGFIPI